MQSHHMITFTHRWWWWWQLQAKMTKTQFRIAKLLVIARSIAFLINFSFSVLPSSYCVFTISLIFCFEWLRCACIFQLLLIRVICLGKIVLLLGTHINFAFVERDRDFVSVTTKRDVMRKAINEMGTFSTAPENFIILFLLLLLSQQ